MRLNLQAGVAGCVQFSRSCHILKISMPLALSLLSACGGGGGGDNAFFLPNNTNTNTNTTDTTTTPTTSELSISLTQPASITYGLAATLTINASNANGTPSFSLVTAPDGMSINSSTGEISFTPTGLHFGTSTTALFTVAVTDNDGTLTQAFSVTVNDNAASQPLVRSSVKGPSKPKSIYIGDFDGIAGNEVLTTDNKSLIYTLKWDPALTGLAAPSGDLYQEWVYPFSLGNQAYINAIYAADVNLDTRLDILVLNGNTVSVIDGASRSLTHSYQISGAETGYALSAADIDGDNIMEIVALVSMGTDQERIYILNLPNPVDSSDQLVVEWNSATANYGQDMVIAAADLGDPQLEIVTSRGYVIDGSSHTDQWTLAKPATGFGDQIIAADVDNDSADEIIGLKPGGVIEVYSPQHQSDLFGQLDPLTDPETSRCVIAAADIDNNGIDEIYAGGCIDDGNAPAAGGSEYLNVMMAVGEATFSSRIWRRPDSLLFYDARLHGGFAGLAIGDVNNDGQTDAIWANAFQEDHFDSFTILELDAGNDPTNFPSAITLLAQSITYGLFDTAFTGAIDFDYDGTTHYATFMSMVQPAEIEQDIDPSFSIGTRAAFIDFNDPEGRVQISSRLTATNAILTGSRVMAADLTGKGQDQLIFSSGLIDSVDNEISALQISDFNGNAAPGMDIHGGWQPEASITPEFFAGIVADNLPSSFDLANLGGDPNPELVGFVGSYLFYYDFSLGTLSSPIGDRQWESIAIDGTGIDVKIADLDDDGISDVVHLTDSAVYLRKRDNDIQHAGSPFYDTIFLFNNSFQGSSFRAMQILDINGDNQMEIIVSSTVTDDDGLTTSTVHLLDNTASELAQLTINGEITDFQLAPNGTNLLAAWKTGGSDTSIASSYISELAFSASMSSVTEVLRSPALLGAVTPNSMNYGPANQLLIGTEYGMYISQ